MTFWKKDLTWFVLPPDFSPYKFPLASEALQIRLLFLAGFWNPFSSKIVTVVLNYSKHPSSV